VVLDLVPDLDLVLDRALDRVPDVTTGRRFMRVVGPWALGVAVLVPAPAHAVAVVDYDFAAGRPVDTTLATGNGGTVAFLNGVAWLGRLAVFPSACSAQPCPRAILEVAPNPAFEPGTQDFRFGATVGLTDADVPGGHNVFQEGLFNDPMQWKLQVDSGRPMCRIKGDAGAVASTAPIVLDPVNGLRSWWRVECSRVGSSVTVRVDRLGTSGAVVQTWTATTVGDIGSVAGATGSPTIGGKGNYANNDQFNGRLDNVAFDVGTW
jgi:hypothetical protein